MGFVFNLVLGFILDSYLDSWQGTFGGVKGWGFGNRKVETRAWLKPTEVGRRPRERPLAEIAKSLRSLEIDAPFSSRPPLDCP